MLQTFKKGGFSIDEYDGKMKEVSDALIANEQSISEEELINFILDGLSFDYDPAVAYIMSELLTPSETISLTETRFFLQKYEQRRNRNTAISSFDMYGGAAHVTAQTRSPALVDWSPKDQKPKDNVDEILVNEVAGNNQNFSFEIHKQSVETNQMALGRGRGKIYSKPELVCQICGKNGHIALECYYRFDISYNGLAAVVKHLLFSHSNNEPSTLADIDSHKEPDSLKNALCSFQTQDIPQFHSNYQSRNNYNAHSYHPCHIPYQLQTQTSSVSPFIGKFKQSNNSASHKNSSNSAVNCPVQLIQINLPASQPIH